HVRARLQLAEPTQGLDVETEVVLAGDGVEAVGPQSLRKPGDDERAREATADARLAPALLDRVRDPDLVQRSAAQAYRLQSLSLQAALHLGRPLVDEPGAAGAALRVARDDHQEPAEERGVAAHQ